MHKTLKEIVAIVVLTGAVLVAGPWIYINFIKDDAPAALELAPVVEPSNSTLPPSTDIAGNWTVATSSNSVVGYRVKEILFGQATEGVGRTKAVIGQLSIEESSVSSASFTVDMTTIMSDAAKRDAQFNGRIMDVDRHPTATFTLSQPISISPAALTGEIIKAKATGKLTLRGTTKEVSFPVEAQLNNATFTVVGSIKIVFGDWGIPAPGIPGISVDPDGLLEFSLEFSRAE